MNWWNRNTDDRARNDSVFSAISVLVLFVIEVTYIVFFYDPASSRAQIGLTIIFALEGSFFLKIANANLEEKKRMGQTSRSTRLLNVAAGLPLLALVGLGVGLANLQQHIALWIVLFTLAACGKIGWLRNHTRLSAADQF